MQLTRAGNNKIMRKQRSIQRRINGKRDQTKAGEKSPTRTNASDSRSSQPLQKSPDIREVSRDPILPLLKRRRTAASDSTPKRNCSGPDLPVTDDVTAKEPAKKRQALNESNQTNIAAASNTQPSKRDCVDAKEKQGQQANAAEAGARNTLKEELEISPRQPS